MNWVPLSGCRLIESDHPQMLLISLTIQMIHPSVLLLEKIWVRVGWLNKDGVCTTAGTDKNAQEHTSDISLLSVDSRWEWVTYEGEGTLRVLSSTQVMETRSAEARVAAGCLSRRLARRKW